LTPKSRLRKLAVHVKQAKEGGSEYGTAWQKEKEKPKRLIGVPTSSTLHEFVLGVGLPIKRAR